MPKILNRFQLSREAYPRQIELLLSQESLEKLQAISARSGLSLGEVITTILDSQLHAPGPTEPDPERKESPEREREEREREGGGGKSV